VRTWRQSDPNGFSAAVGAFAGLTPELGWLGTCCAATAQPPWCCGAMAGAPRGHARPARGADGLLALGAACSASPPLPGRTCWRWPAATLIDADTRPDDRVLWQGEPDDPWSLGGLLAGATLICRWTPRLITRLLLAPSGRV